MKILPLCGLLALLAMPLVAGCSDKGGEPTVADGNDIAAYVSENPESDAGTEVEGGDQ